MIPAVMAPVVTTVEWLQFSPMSSRTRQFFDAMRQAADSCGVDVMTTERYLGEADWLMLWGAGAPDRFPSMRHQRQRGKHVVSADLAYWDKARKVRVSVDGPHPQAWVMHKNWPGTRLESDGIVLRNAWDSHGPVLIAGIGPKATIQYGADVVARWEADRITECQALGYDRLIYRHKRHHGAIPDGTTRAPAVDIDTVLEGCSLVVTWHSNVAVDALRLGIPVVCHDGAAAAICPATVTTRLAPVPAAVRDRFLANLAWFQWGPYEAVGCWAFLRELLA